MVTIDHDGTQYWSIEFDMFPVKKFERFSVVDYSDHILPLYELYVKQAKLPIDKKHCVGGSRALRFKVKKEDAEMLAEELFDLLVNLAEWDELLFDKNPYELGETGANSEGFNPEISIQQLIELTDQELMREWMQFKKNQPYHKKYLAWIEQVLKKRSIQIPDVI